MKIPRTPIFFLVTNAALAILFFWFAGVNGQTGQPTATDTQSAELSPETYSAMVSKSIELSPQIVKLQGDLVWYEQQLYWLDQMKKLQNQIDAAKDKTVKDQLLQQKSALFDSSQLPMENLSLQNLQNKNDIDFFLNKNKNYRQDTQNRLDDLTKQKDALTREIDNYLNIERPNQEFKKAISGYFTILVACVIVLFFVVALKDPEVAREIFSGDAGLQFVALFAVVIAIILFGILGILDGKELSALLGGLSGYILGRSTPEKRTSASSAVTPPSKP